MSWEEGAWALLAHCLTCVPLVQAKRYTPFGNGIRNCVGQQLAMSNVPTGRCLGVACMHQPPHVSWHSMSSFGLKAPMSSVTCRVRVLQAKQAEA